MVNSSTYDCVNQVMRSEFQVQSLTIHKTCEGICFDLITSVFLQSR